MGHMAVVSYFFPQLADYTITEKLFIFRFIIDLQAKWPYGQEQYLQQNIATQ